MKLRIQPEIADAIKSGRPVVAMESTVYSSLGLPQPANLEAHTRACEAVTAVGATAAVTAIVGGEPRVGLTDAEMIEVLESGGSGAGSGSGSGAGSSGATARKVSLSDLPVALAQRWDLGVTTVSASLAMAHRAGIRVFATGGIGGVHRENPNDVSADLEALARFGLATVCSGAKAFLDLDATTERLETLGVAVVGYQTRQFPAFWSRESDISLAHRVQTPDEAAEIVRQVGASRSGVGASEPGVGASEPEVGTPGPGVLFVVPPPEDVALAWADIKGAVAQALEEVKQQGIVGGAVTPFILQRVSQATGGATLPANVSLVANNAAIAAQIAVSLARG